jgi:D-amino-acid dehydrogenase
MAAQLGVKFRFGVTIRGLERSGERITGVKTDSGMLTADQYILALGSYSPLLLKPIGIDVPVYPVKGFSITVPIDDPAMSPESTIMDETHKVAVTRLGDRIRVGGTAQLSGYELELDAKRRRTLEFVVTDLFPKGGEVSKAEFWTGLRPMTPDGTPIVGATRYTNLLLSTGHGTLGWTMAAGTGRVMADLVSGREPEIRVDDLAVARYA